MSQAVIMNANTRETVMAAVSTLKLNLREKFKLLAETRDSESKLLQQNQSLLSRVANLETCIRDEQTLNQSLQSKLEVVTQQLKTNEEQFDRVLKEECSRYFADVERTKGLVSAQQGELIQLKSRSFEWEREREVLLREKSTLESKLATLTAALTAAEEQNRDLQAAFDHAKINKSEFHAAVEDAMTKITEGALRMRDQEKADAPLRDSIAHLQDSIRERDAALVRAEADRSRVDSERMVLEYELGRVRSQLEVCRAGLSKMIQRRRAAVDAQYGYTDMTDDEVMADVSSRRGAAVDAGNSRHQDDAVADGISGGVEDHYSRYAQSTEISSAAHSQPSLQSEPAPAAAPQPAPVAEEAPVPLGVEARMRQRLAEAAQSASKSVSISDNAPAVLVISRTSSVQPHSPPPRDVSPVAVSSQPAPATATLNETVIAQSAVAEAPCDPSGEARSGADEPLYPAAAQAGDPPTPPRPISPVPATEAAISAQETTAEDSARAESSALSQVAGDTAVADSTAEPTSQNTFTSAAEGSPSLSQQPSQAKAQADVTTSQSAPQSESPAGSQTDRTYEASVEEATNEAAGPALSEPATIEPSDVPDAEGGDPAATELAVAESAVEEVASSPVDGRDEHQAAADEGASAAEEDSAAAAETDGDDPIPASQEHGVCSDDDVMPPLDPASQGTGDEKDTADHSDATAASPTPASADEDTSSAAESVIPSQHGLEEAAATVEVPAYTSADDELDALTLDSQETAEVVQVAHAAASPAAPRKSASISDDDVAGILDAELSATIGSPAKRGRSDESRQEVVSVRRSKRTRTRSSGPVIDLD